VAEDLGRTALDGTELPAVHSEEWPDSVLWQFLGLSEPHMRNNVSMLMRAKARARLADLQPQSAPAIVLIERHLDGLAEAERVRLTAERALVDAAWKRYLLGDLSLSELVFELRTINGEDWE
jgi:hypothetical protein